MNDRKLQDTLHFIRPEAHWVLRGEALEWLDEKQTEPTKAEIEAGWIALEAKREADKINAVAKKAAAEAKLAALGLDADDLKALGLV